MIFGLKPCWLERGVSVCRRVPAYITIDIVAADAGSVAELGELFPRRATDFAMGS